MGFSIQSYLARAGQLYHLLPRCTQHRVCNADFWLICHWAASQISWRGYSLDILMRSVHYYWERWYICTLGDFCCGSDSYVSDHERSLIIVAFIINPGYHSLKLSTPFRPITFQIVSRIHLTGTSSGAFPSWARCKCSSSQNLVSSVGASPGPHSGANGSFFFLHLAEDGIQISSLHSRLHERCQG